MDPEALENLVADINHVLRARGWSARQASLAAGDNQEMVRDLRRGRIPSVERLASLCRVLDLEFYAGAPRERGPLDERRLEEAVAAIERTLATQGLALEPRDKARAVVALYLLLDREREPVTAQRVERLVQGLAGAASRADDGPGP